MQLEAITGSEARPQAKGIERAVCIMKEGIYANWLALERHCNARIALESPLLGYLVGHVYRTYNAFCEGKAGSTPLERLRDVRGGQAPRSYPFGAVGFVKPVHAQQMAWSAFGVVSLPRDEVLYWGRLLGLPVHCG